MDAEMKKYELAYLLSPGVAEEELFNWKEKLLKLITELGGTTKHTEEPKKRKLSYLVKKQNNAYFGWFDFIFAPSLLPQLEKRLKGLDNLLRYLIVEWEEFALKTPYLKTIPSRPSIAFRPALPQREVKPPTQEVPKLDLEELDKKLEEILGK